MTRSCARQDSARLLMLWEGVVPAFMAMPMIQQDDSCMQGCGLMLRGVQSQAQQHSPHSLFTFQQCLLIELKESLQT